MIITSPQFEAGGWMPDFLSGYGDDLSPEIMIEDAPSNASSLAIVMDDLDHPVSPGFNHWIAWNISPADHIPGALPKGALVEDPIHIEQGVGYGKHCYRGPKPPFNWNHRYRFTVYALDTLLSLDANSKKAELKNVMEGHVLAEAELIGRYQRKHD